MKEGYIYNIALSYAKENEKLVETVYHYLKSEGLSVFFAPSKEGQMALSGMNQREVFYSVFGLQSEYVALFVSEHYIRKVVPMEEARISFAKHENGFVIPIYLDDSKLDKEMLDPEQVNYFKSANAAEIASHIAGKIKHTKAIQKGKQIAHENSVMNVSGNMANTQVFIQNAEGTINL